MRRSVCAVLLLVMCFALPLSADDNPGIPIVEPEQGESGCEECTYSRSNDALSCEPDPVAAGWMNCVGEWVYQCDATGSCTRYADCGQRCAIA